MGLFGGLLNALGVGPAQEAQANQAQQNYAQGVNQQASQTAQTQQLYNWMNMMQNYQQYLNQNPNPVNTWSPIQQPGQITGSIGGGTVGGAQPQGQAPQRPSQSMPGMQQGQQGQQQSAVPQSLAASLGMLPGQANGGSATSGLPVRYLQSLLGGQGAT